LTPEVTIKKLLKVGESYSKLGSPEKIAQEKALLRNYRALGTVDEMKQLTETAQSYTKVGSLKDIKTLVEAFKQYKALGSISEIKKLCAVLEAYSKLGNPKEVAAMTEALKSYQDLGSTQEINQVLGVAESYLKIGGKPRQLSEKLKRAAQLETKLNEAKRKNAARKIAEKLNVPEKAAFDLLGKLPAKEVIEHLRSLREANEIKPKKLNSAPSQLPTSMTSMSERFFKDSYVDLPEVRDPNPGNR
jgi:hypothetical protein